jgi:F0F1-type ATP synthase membrane subunit a
VAGHTLCISRNAGQLTHAAQVTRRAAPMQPTRAGTTSISAGHVEVPNLVNEQIGGLSGNVKQKFFPCVSVTFTFLLFHNPQGMIPFSFTVTSHFLITLALSFSIFIGITIIGFQRHGLHFLARQSRLASLSTAHF